MTGCILRDALRGLTKALENEMSNQVALSPELDAFILSVAPPHYPTADAPNESAELLAWAKTHTIGRDPVPVWDGASDDSIYGSPEVNFAYRAWHDATHIKLDLDFTPDAEKQVALNHVREAWEAGLSVDACNLLWIDSQGQNEYFAVHQDFVQNQRLFAKVAVKFGIQEAIAAKL